MKPKGQILLIGGKEDIPQKKPTKNKKINTKFKSFEIIKELISHNGNQKVEVITTASSNPKLLQSKYRKAFKSLKLKPPGFLHIESKVEAHKKKFLKILENADNIFFSGSDQFRLATILGGTPVLDLIKERFFHEKNFLVAGTSAGAMVFSELMILSGGKEAAIFQSDLKTSSGFGLLPNCIIDTHFIERNRFRRLAQSVIVNPDHIGIGLGEDTALLIKDGNKARCCGSGMAVVVDGKDIGKTNIASVTEHEPIYVENLKMHILVEGCSYLINERRFQDR